MQYLSYEWDELFEIQGELSETENGNRELEKIVQN